MNVPLSMTPATAASISPRIGARGVVVSKRGTGIADRLTRTTRSPWVSSSA
jgi:hypothetical protein